MARPRSEDKRNAIMVAATGLIVSQGLSAPTSIIAKTAGVSNGSLFTYFETKADLFNALYLELKNEMATAAMNGLPATGLRDQVFHLWTNWMEWASVNPEKRRALAQLSVSEEITPANRIAGHQAMAGIAGLMEQCRSRGSLRYAPMGFFVGIMNSLADATMDFMIQDPANAATHSQTGFEALWRVIS
ncbi:TetR/AcrR family transcriptional regulator [Undibacterium sp. TC4M20W]|uniref:TetR/AcrR family transcriptional regulator n=1 Tax=unclassified Undibacterium TaxID=2630295 RepID=UPI003BF1C19F